jgi:hypothetical protein
MQSWNQETLSVQQDCADCISTHGGQYPQVTDCSDGSVYDCDNAANGLNWYHGDVVMIEENGVLTKHCGTITGTTNNAPQYTFLTLEINCADCY